MFIILGGTGHIGSAVAKTLLEQGKPVTIVTSNRAKAAEWENQDAFVAEADVHDADSLRQVFLSGKRAFLLNPPAPITTDTDAEEKLTISNIVAALEGSGLEKVVAESTYGAQPGERIGDLSTLYGFEQALKQQPIPVTIVRGAYYMTNLDAMLEGVKKEGVLNTMYPPDLKLPMVAPSDIGEFAARFLLEDTDETGLHLVEGPDHYSMNDVADELSKALGRPVRIEVTPRDRWFESFKAVGFSDAAADSFIRMTEVSVKGNFAVDGTPLHGKTTLREYIQKLVAEKAS